jgi:hypothetical protein
MNNLFEISLHYANKQSVRAEKLKRNQAGSVQFQGNGSRHLGIRERDNSNPDCSRTGEKRRHSSIVNRQR